ncbi:S8 family peptidase [Streptococcus parasuis]|uniref:S8 family peptidase n=1 Tax=Streptococcus parasuis TaxID=1501662 RepID=UPI0028AE6E21|nr:S8 family peptidase [Streptococcus parasuis]
MNDILQLKGRFEQRSSSSKPGSPKLLSNKVVTINELIKLRKQLDSLRQYWETVTYFEGALITIVYKDIVAKSRRAKELLKKNSRTYPNDLIVGARYIEGDKTQHAITYYVDNNTIIETINKLDLAIEILNEEFSSRITTDVVDAINAKLYPYSSSKLSKTTFLQVIVDVSSIEKFTIPEANIDSGQRSIVSVFKTELQTSELLHRLGLDISISRVIDDSTILLTPDEIALIMEKAPYLISMATVDLSQLDILDFDEAESSQPLSIPEPSNEPIIGVIDTLFDENVYFSKWVKYEDRIDSQIEKMPSDYEHGTGVSSIIVDGASINPDLDDNCGRFRVKHFGVATSKQFSSFTIMKHIKEIVAENREIKVWNLSLGSALEIHKDFISPEAAILDKIQYDYDVIFVVAGTNKPSDSNGPMLIGAPADSINSIIVNAVNRNNVPASYSRIGKVLSFFNKPDVSYYGGDGKDRVRVCFPLGEGFVKGTSFAAPWITRKIAFLIHKVGLSREVAKALVIDSAISWSQNMESSNVIGYGVVPQDINEVINAKDDEIKFILSGESLKYDTYNHQLPVPIVNGQHPFVAKATLCYFPKCCRNQGVDYTNTELDIYFGRMLPNGKGIKTINDNKQSDNVALHEEDAREQYRKWDNVKSIIEYVKPRRRAKKAYDNGLWGFSLKTKERLNTGDGEGLKFGIVVTLKEINGINRIDDFINQCSMRGWLVQRIDVEELIQVHSIAEEEISFDE